MSDEAVALNQRELLMEMRHDMRRLETAVSAQGAEIGRLADMIAKEQELGTERRASMRRTADQLVSKIDTHDARIDALEQWRDRADGAAVFAKAAFGTSIIALVVAVLQIVNTVDPALFRAVKP